MIGVTIGIGEGWFECAHWAARRMEDMTGIACIVIDQSVIKPIMHPSWHKHRILDLVMDDNDFVYFDADIIPLNPWNPKEIFEKNGRKLCAVLDNNSAMASQVRAEEIQIGIPRGTYLNSGLFIFGREHAPVFESTWARRPQWNRWIDQSAWNRVLYDLRTPVAVLPQCFNEMDLQRDATVNLHCHSLGGDWSRLKRFQNAVSFTASLGGAGRSQSA